MDRRFQVVAVSIADTHNSGHHAYGYSSGNPTGAGIFPIHEGDRHNGFAGRHGDGRTEMSIGSLPTELGTVVSQLSRQERLTGNQFVMNGELPATYSNLPTNGLMFDAQTPKFAVGSSPNNSIKEMLQLGKFLYLAKY